MRLRSPLFGVPAFLALGLVFLTFPALAQNVVGEPREWQLWHQPPSSTQAQGVDDLHLLLLIIAVVICCVVIGLLLFIAFRFGERRNPVPSRTTHNTLLEVAWTAVPVLILLVIAIPSFRLLFYMERVPEADMTLKVTGNAWYWSYEYPDHGEFTFDSMMIPTDQLEPGQRRLLEVDNPVVLPTNTNIRVLMTSNDVLHAWAIPAFAVKRDVIPGRLSESWIRIEREGIYYGQCSELCGVLHAFMPVTVHAVSPEAFEQWVAEAQQQFARPGEPAPPTRLAEQASD
jgi:cytochrome c oxidase subunit 2